MSKAKFEAAKELIQEKKYSEARAILKGIDHPTAKLWLSKLDKLTPEPVSKKSNSNTLLIAVLLLVLISLSIVLVVFVAKRFIEVPSSTASNTTTSTDFSQIVYVYCNQEYKVEDQCKELTQYIIGNYSQEVNHCYATFGSALSDMGSCLRPQIQIAYNTVWKSYLTQGALSTFCNNWVASTGVDTRPTKGCEQWATDILAIAPVEAVDKCFRTYLAFDIDSTQFRDPPAWEFSVNCLSQFIDEQTWDGGSKWLPSYRPNG